LKPHGKCGSVGLQVLTQELLNTKQKCQPLDMILTINDYDIFQNTIQMIFVMGWWCFLLRQEQKRLTQSQAGSCKMHILASPCILMSILPFPCIIWDPPNGFFKLNLISRCFAEIYKGSFFILTLARDTVRKSHVTRWVTIGVKNIYDKHCCTEKIKTAYVEKSMSVQTQINSVGCTKHVSTYLRSSSGVGVLVMRVLLIVWVFC